MPSNRLIRNYRNLKRYHQIISVFVRYGFGDIISRLSLDYFIQAVKYKNIKKSQFEKISIAARLRMAFEELGPTFVKFGQVLSIRPDMLPESFIEEFKKLQDNVPPFSGEQAIEEIETQLGKSVEELYSSFDATPIASASIAQVHRAMTNTHEQVIIKIQRPNIQNMIDTDLRILSDLAKLIEKNVQESHLFSPCRIVSEFSKTIQSELNFYREGQNIERFHKNFADDKTVYIPKVYWELTTDRILTMEYIDGIKISKVDELEASGLNKKIIAINGAQLVLKQIFEYGFFHADPHPGNIFVLPDNIIAPLDFGMVGSLDEEEMEAVGALLTAFVKKDVKKIISVLVNLGIMENALDIRNLKIDLSDFLDRYYQVPLFQLDIGKILNEIIAIMRNHHIQLPAELTLMGKALVTEESVGRTLDPEFDMVSLAKPYVEKMMIRKLDPRRHLRDFSDTLDEFIRLFKILPSEIRVITAKVKTGEIKIQFEHRGLDNLIAGLNRTGNRLSFSLIVAALIIGSSLIAHSEKGPQIHDLSVLGIFGYLIAAFFGLWLVITIFRNR
ncbi:MAG: 2-polyprenylphenol 6-hydroxylase [Candidatus Marinimicrobia bacterium]|nr:2-polyprenylphenol 6-hydroxylase [Candidatus Neomarinimicrobiota bacterium]